MAYNTKKMLEDVNGDLIPQWYDPEDDEFKPLTNDQRTGSVNLHQTQNTIPSQGVLEINLDDLQNAKEIIICVGTNSQSSKYNISAFNRTLGSSRFGKTIRDVTVEEVEEEVKTSRTTHVAHARFEVFGNSMRILIKRTDTGSAPLYGDVMIMGVY